MGLFDTISGLLACPYCGNEAFVSFQTKDLAVTMAEFTAGGKVVGGPYLDGEYGRHRLRCQTCTREYFPVAVLRNQVITGLKAYRIEDVPARAHLPEDVIAVDPAGLGTPELCGLIVSNLIGLLVDERVVIEKGEFSYLYIVKNGYDPETDQLRFDLPGRQVARLYDYVRLLCFVPDPEVRIKACLDQLIAEGLSHKLEQLSADYPFLEDVNLASLSKAIAPALPVAQEILQRFAAIAKQKGATG
jgi:hypothetical protein